MTNHPNTNVQRLFTSASPSDGEKKPSESGDWMPLQEASNATGISMGTLRRYIKAGKISHRRLGRTAHAKLEVLVTPDMLPDSPGTEFFGVEDDEEVEVIDQADQSDQVDQPLLSTLAWLQQKLDEKDKLLREKDAKIASMGNELQNAYYRNGYLEAQQSEFQEKLLLLEDKSKAKPTNQHTAETIGDVKAGTWSKISRWLMGK